MENTAKKPVLGASVSGGASCWLKSLSLMLRLHPPPPEKAPYFGSAKPQTNEPDKHKESSCDRDPDTSEQFSRYNSLGRNE